MTPNTTGSTQRSSSRRGQTEPLAAIVAVSTFVAAFGIYAVFVGGLPLTDDRELAEPTNDRIWQAISDSDVYRPGSTDIENRVDHHDVPDGHHAYVAVIAYTERGKEVQDQVYLRPNGTELPVAEQHFEPDGSVNHDASLPPDRADVSEESVDVAIEPGRVRGGVLHVEVWE